MNRSVAAGVPPPPEFPVHGPNSRPNFGGWPSPRTEFSPPRHQATRPTVDTAGTWCRCGDSPSGSRSVSRSILSRGLPTGHRPVPSQPGPKAQERCPEIGRGLKARPIRGHPSLECQEPIPRWDGPLALVPGWLTPWASGLSALRALAHSTRTLKNWGGRRPVGMGMDPGCPFPISWPARVVQKPVLRLPRNWSR